MIPLIWSALAARRAVSTAMFLLAALVTTGLSLAPWYASRATDTATAARIAAAPQGQRTVSANSTISVDLAGETVVHTFATSAQRALALPVDGQAVGVELAATVSAGDRQLLIPLRYREALCANAVIDGHCPQATGEVILSAQSAERLGAHVGDRLDMTTGPAPVLRPLRLVGIYHPADPLSWYWATAADAAWTTFDTVAAAGATVRATFDAMLSPPVFTRGGDLASAIDRMRRVPLQVSTTGGALAERIAADRRVVERGVLIAAVQLAVIGWLAMVVAARYAADERRPDAAQLALRGARRWRLLAVTSGQTGVPLAAGTVAGALVGVLAGGPGRLPIAGGVLAAALAGAVLADWRTTRLPVERLLHAATPRPPRLGAAVVEVCVLGLTGASIYQSLSTGGTIGVQLLAPGLLAASAAILVGRLLVPAATAVGRSALVSGRIAVGFGALLLARRSSAYRMIPLLAAAGCLFVVAAQDWAVAGNARHGRSEVEVGGQRVLTVASGDRVRLLNAVRAADPGGRQAMAVVAGLGPGGEPVLAVDSPRLPYVLAAPAALDSRRLRPAAPAPITFSGTGLALVASVPAAGGLPDAGADPPTGPPVLLATLVVAATGVPVTARFTPIEGVSGTASAHVPDCRSGCRLVSFELVGGRAVELHQLDADGKTVITPAVFADPGRWRTGAGNVAATVSMRSYDGRLALAAVSAGLSKLPVDDRLYVVDAPMPLPAAVAGRLPASDERGTGTIDPFGSRAVPVEPIAAPLLPGVGTRGILVDLEYADRVAGGAPRAERQQVWLAHDAPAGLIDRLRDAGLTVVAEDSVGAADARQARFGPAAAARFGLLMGTLGLLAAAIALAVIAAVQRRARGDEFVALRRQGVPARALNAAGRWAALVPTVLAALTAALAAAAARAITHAPIPAFTDAWPDPTGAASVGALVLLAATAVVAALFTGCALAPRYQSSGRP
jgi:putative ABC transport system permease protein